MTREKERKGGCWFEQHKCNKGIDRSCNTAERAQQRDYLFTSQYDGCGFLDICDGRAEKKGKKRWSDIIIVAWVEVR
jgi:hypothetical protein